MNALREILRRNALRRQGNGVHGLEGAAGQKPPAQHADGDRQRRADE